MFRPWLRVHEVREKEGDLTKMDRPKTADEALHTLRINHAESYNASQFLDALQAYVELSIAEATAALLERLKEDGRLL